MLNDLKFVQGAVAKKDYVPALTFFKIADGRIYGYNGVLAISTPTDLQVTATPKAAPFVKAIERIPENTEVVLNLTEAGRLSVKAGRFRAYVECHAESDHYPDIKPAGEMIALPGGILPILRKLSPFMGIDASRSWAMGILFKGQSAFATNNIVLLEHWLGDIAFPVPINLPAEAIKEMLRVGVEPVAMQLEENAITFHYPSGAWMRTALYSTDWPDLSRVLDVACSSAYPVPDGFFDAVQRLDAFVEKSGRLHLRGGVLATSAHDDQGALVELDDFGGIGCHYLSQMAKLDGIATKIDFSMYPAPCLFFGDMVRGAIVGMRVHDAV